ncbi:MAG: ribonuclease HII [Candidatus Omnitrophica bacterium]|nr:ribonuclease HII [Candidatus Omnitrophota bacterium]
MKKRSNTPRVTRLLLHEKSLNSSGYSSIAGVDEAGRGPLAGPVVAGAVIIKDVRFEERIDDSKKLTVKRREVAYREILKKSIVGVGIIDERTIDKINIYQATKKAMQMAISKLKIPPDYVIVDGNMKIATKCPLKCIIGGDSKSLSIAAASIVAKVTRDRIMVKYDKLYPQYGFAKHKGYGTREHMVAIKNNGASPIHRNSFRPIRDLPTKLY